MNNSDILIYHGIINVLFLIFLINRYGFRSVVSFLSLLYTFTALSSYFYSNTPLFVFSYSNEPISLDSCIYLNLINFMLIFPFRHFKIENIYRFSKMNFGKLRMIVTYVLIANLVFLILDTPSIIEGLFTSNLKGLRDSTYEVFELPWWHNPVLGIIKRITTAFDPIFFFLSIFGLIYDNKKKIYKYCLLIYILNVIKIIALLGSRGIVFYLLIDCILLYILFYPMISKAIKKKIIFISFIGLFGFGSFISAMTIARFSEGSGMASSVSEAIETSMLLYTGESGINFMGSMYGKESTLLYGYDTFPLFRRMMGLEYVDSDRQLATDYFENATNARAFIFYQLGGALYSNFGKYGTLIILLFFNIYIGRIASKKRNFSFISFLIMFFYSSIVAKGIFYYSLKTEGGNLSYVIIFIIYLYFIEEKKTMINKPFNKNETLLVK